MFPHFRSARQKLSKKCPSLTKLLAYGDWNYGLDKNLFLSVFPKGQHLQLLCSCKSSTPCESDCVLSDCKLEDVLTPRPFLTTKCGCDTQIPFPLPTDHHHH